MIRKWAQKQIAKYKHLYPRYVKYTEVLQNLLENVSRKYAPLSIVQTRTKSIGSFAEKILRKKDKYRNPILQITDLCGGRIIANTSSEVNAICDFIRNNFDIDWENSVDVSQRLKPSEFGYRSIHYIVQLKHGVFPGKDINVVIPKDIYGLKAEIQVRTILEHAWADFCHDRSYKGAFKIPAKWEREMATLSAILEGFNPMPPIMAPI
jgi:putative GTP pyrophosphokinase